MSLVEIMLRPRTEVQVSYQSDEALKYSVASFWPKVGVVSLQLFELVHLVAFVLGEQLGMVQESRGHCLLQIMLFYIRKFKLHIYTHEKMHDVCMIDYKNL